MSSETLIMNLMNIRVSESVSRMANVITDKLLAKFKCTGDNVDSLKYFIKLKTFRLYKLEVGGNIFNSFTGW